MRRSWCCRPDRTRASRRGPAGAGEAPGAFSCRQFYLLFCAARNASRLACSEQGGARMYLVKNSPRALFAALIPLAIVEAVLLVFAIAGGQVTDPEGVPA